MDSTVLATNREQIMSATIYTINLGFDQLRVRADLNQASAPIEVFGDEDFVPTQFQTADARHRVSEMARLAVRAMGPDYWLDPSSDYPDDEDAYIGALIKSVTEH